MTNETSTRPGNYLSREVFFNILWFTSLLRACVNVRSTMKLLIRNLARITTEQEIRALFESFGTVQSCNLILDKQTGGSKGFAFIEMPRPGEAKAAVKSLNGKPVDNNTVRVKYADMPAKGQPTGK